MKLLRFHVQNFGTLKDLSLELEGGLNVLYRENGWGKTTLAVFIKAMLYGLPATSKRSLDENERKKYAPWQGGSFGGSIEFETEAGTFRAERFFGAKESADTFALYDLATGLESRTYSENLGVELFGIDADGYERTVYLSQRGIPSKGENYSITAKLGDLLDDVDDVGGFDAAAEALDKRYKYYVTTGNRGRIAVLEGEIAQREREREELLRVRKTLEEREEEARELAAKTEALLCETENVRGRLRRAADARAQAALLSERARMERELSELTARRDALETALGGHHPDGETLQKATAAVVRLRELSAKLREIPEEREVRTELFLPRADKALPREEEIRSLSEENDRLQTLGAKLSLLEGQGDDGRYARFAGGVPDEGEMRECFTALQAPKKGRGQNGNAVSSLLIAAGAVASALFLVLTVVLGGNALALIGLVASLCVLCVGGMTARSAKQTREREEKALLRVRRLLERYGMHGSDPYRDLCELSLLRDEYLKAREAKKVRQRECEAIKREYKEAQNRVKNGFSMLGITLPEKAEYTDEVRALSRDVSLLLRTRRESLALSERRARTEEEMQKCRMTLQALLPLIGCREGQEIMSAIESAGRLETEYCLIASQISARALALEKFNAEHSALSDATEGTDEDPTALSETEKRLSDEIRHLSERQAALKTQIERLSAETDRLPECEAALFSLGEELEEARENSATVKATLGFLQEAKVGLSTRYLDGMQKSLARYLSYLSPYAEDAVMNASFEVSLRAEGKTRDTDYFSRGQRDVIGLCTRLSLTDALYATGEKPCLILDDPFVNLDDVRLREARRLLDRLASEYQIIYMVCHTGRE